MHRVYSQGSRVGNAGDAGMQKIKNIMEITV
jgi:hypothetical protein